MSRRAARAIQVCVLLAAATAAGPARAQSSRAAARAYTEGVSAFQARDYDTAYARFRQAYQLSHSPELLVNLGLSLERLGRRDEAAASYREYLSTMPSAPNRAEIESRIARIEAARAPAPVPVAPPVVEPPPPVVEPPPPVVEPPPPRVWPWVTFGAGAALTVAGALLFALPGDPGDDAAVRDEQAYLRARDDRETLQVIGAAVGGVGVVAMTVGLVGLAVSPPSSSARATWRIGGRAFAQGALLEVGHAF